MTNEETVEEMDWKDELRRMFPPQGRETGAYFAALSQVKAFISRTLDTEIQKARASWLRSEIEKLEGMYRYERSMSASMFDGALTSIITRYKEELLELEKTQ